MKVTVTYDFPDDEYKFKMSMLGRDLALAVVDLDNYLRDKLKHEKLTSEQDKIYEEIRTQLHEKLAEYNLNINKLYGE